jgi:hypothetical protein
MLRVGAAINGFRMLVIQDKKLVQYVMGKNGLFLPRVGANIYRMEENYFVLKIFVFECLAFNQSFH